MKIQKIGTVIYLDEYSAKVKIKKSKKYNFYCDCQENKILTVNNNINAKLGDEVFIEINRLKNMKLMYICYIQPVIFIVIGMLCGEIIKQSLNQPSIFYNYIFSLIFFTIGIIYKDYYKEKNKHKIENNHKIVKIIS